MNYANPDQEVLYIGPPPVNRLGKTGFWTSLLGLFTCGFLSPLGLFLSLVALRKRPRGAATAGLLLGLLGSAWVGLLAAVMLGGAISAKALEAAKFEMQTRAACVQATEVIEQYRQTTGRLPEGIEGNKLVLQFSDAWGNALRYDLDDSDYTIRSSGPDREFDTADDLIHQPGIPHFDADEDDD